MTDTRVRPPEVLTDTEYRVLALCEGACQKWAERDPHDDFRFGMTDLMRLGELLAKFGVVAS